MYLNTSATGRLICVEISNFTIGFKPPWCLEHGRASAFPSYALWPGISSGHAWIEKDARSPGHIQKWRCEFVECRAMPPSCTVGIGLAVWLGIQRPRYSGL